MLTLWVLAKVFYCILDIDVSNFDEFRAPIISVMIIVNITLNTLSSPLIARHPKLRDGSTTLFVLSLTLSDLTNGYSAMPISASVCSSATLNVRSIVHYFPKIHAIFSIWFNVNSMHSLCLVTMYKMVAVTKPLRYDLTRSRCYFIICGTWLTGALVAPANMCIHMYLE